MSLAAGARKYGNKIKRNTQLDGIARRLRSRYPSVPRSHPGVPGFFVVCGFLGGTVHVGGVAREKAEYKLCLSDCEDKETLYLRSSCLADVQG